MIGTGDTIQQDREIQIIQKETSNLREKIQTLQIVDDSSEKLGATYLSFLAKALKNLETARVRLTKPILDAKKNVDNEFKAMMEMPTQLARILKDRLLEYSNVKEQKEKEKVGKVAQFAKDNGLPVPAADAPSAPQSTAVRTTVGTTFEKKNWTWKVVDEAKIPREFLTIDEKKINSRMREATKNIHGVVTMSLKIDGVEFYQEKDIAVRT